MMDRQELKKNRELLIDKAKGALCGLAIGDSLGDAARKPDIQINYGFITDFLKTASWSTDDTEFALLVTETMIKCGGDFTTEDVERMWLEHVAIEDELRRGGPSEMEGRKNLLRGLHAPLSGKYNSYGTSDGAAMRCGPIGIFCAGDPKRAVELAGIDASVSHDRDGVWGAQAIAAAVAMAMVDTPFEDIFQKMIEIAPKDSWLRFSMNVAVNVVKEAEGDVMDAWMKLHENLRDEYRSSITEALPAALGCMMMRHEDFRSGVVLASNFARDADTIAAMAGAVLGARYGAKGIPKHWLEKTRYPSGTCLSFTKGIDIFDKAEKLAELVMNEELKGGR